jgi:hypothetical protein
MLILLFVAVLGCFWSHFGLSFDPLAQPYILSEIWDGKLDPY